MVTPKIQKAKNSGDQDSDGYGILELTNLRNYECLLKSSSN